MTTSPETERPDDAPTNGLTLADLTLEWRGRHWYWRRTGGDKGILGSGPASWLEVTLWKECERLRKEARR